MTEPIIVVGGGIGGLTLAIALGRRGIPCLLLEREAAPTTAGSGLGLWSRAGARLETLGLGDELARHGAPITRAQIRDRRGRTLLEVELRRPGRPPTRFLRRADLHALLHRALPPLCELRLGARCEAVEDDGRVATVRLASGDAVEGRLVVAADGLRSIVRAQLWPESRCIPVGQTAWRGIVDVSPESHGLAWEAWCPGARFGVAPLADGTTCWWATREAPPSPDAAGIPEHERAALAEFFAPFPLPAEAIVARTPAAAILRTTLHEAPSLPASHRGRVALLGDAAHAMAPSLGQGAGAAIEDAVVLADLLAEHDVVPALARYEARRRKRTSRLAWAARRIGDAGHWKSPLLRTLRDASLRLLPASGVRGLLDP